MVGESSSSLTGRFVGVTSLLFLVLCMMVKVSADFDACQEAYCVVSAGRTDQCFLPNGTIEVSSPAGQAVVAVVALRCAGVWKASCSRPCLSLAVIVKDEKEQLPADNAKPH